MVAMSHRTLIPVRALFAVLTATLALVLLAGCGGSGGDHQGGKDSSAPKGYTSAKQVGEALGCTDTLDDFKQAGVTEGIVCAYADDNVVVSWFSTTELAKAFQDRTPPASAPTSYVYGSNWAVGCFTESVCTSAQKVLGGKLGTA